MIRYIIAPLSALAQLDCVANNSQFKSKCVYNNCGYPRFAHFGIYTYIGSLTALGSECENY